MSGNTEPAPSGPTDLQGNFEAESDGPIIFPETAEEESKRVGDYFRDHPLAQPHHRRDTYGDEDSSLPESPTGDPYWDKQLNNRGRPKAD